MNNKERISHTDGDRDAWVCICENRPWEDGFYPCNDKGEEVEPIRGWKELYVCGRCGRIIHCVTLKVVGQSVAPAEEAVPETLGSKLDDLLATFERIEKRLLEMKAADEGKK